jgi:hypothetical protein
MRRWGLTAQRGRATPGDAGSIEDIRLSDNVRQVEYWSPHFKLDDPILNYRNLCGIVGVVSCGARTAAGNSLKSRLTCPRDFGPLIT